MLRALAFLLLLPLAAAAEGRALLPAHEQAEWNAAGRLNLGGGFCSGALIAPDLVVTAAHCLYAPRTGVERLPERLTFVAGYRMMKHQGFAKAARFAIHPDYAFTGEAGMEEIAADLALVRLAEPLAPAPFGLAAGIEEGDEVTILSYARDRPEIPSLQSPCGVLARRGAVAVLDCDVTWGVSGAPVFRLVEGDWRIVAVISAMGQWRGEKAAFAVALDEALGPVLAAD